MAHAAIRWASILTGLILLVTRGGCSRAAVGSFTEQSLGQVRQEFVVERIDADGRAYAYTVNDWIFAVISSDFRRCAAVVPAEGGGERLVVDGHLAHPVYDEVGLAYISGDPYGVRFNRDATRLAYAARRGKWYMVVDGRAEGPYEAVEGPKFSPDGRRLAYSARTNGGWQVALDGRAGPGFECLEAPWLQFSHDSQRLAYTVFDSGGTTVVLDGTAHRLGQARQIQISGDGLHYVCVRYSPQAATLIVDGREIAHAAGATMSPQISRSGRHVIAHVRQGRQRQLIVNGRMVASLPLSPAELPGAGKQPPPRTGFATTFSPDGERLAYRVQGDGWATVAIDEQTVATWDEAGQVQFSADSRTSAYAARKGSTWHVVVDRRARATGTKRLDHLTLSPDGRRVAFVEGEGDESVLVCGRHRVPLKGEARDRPVFSPDGRRVACVVNRSSQMILFVDGREQQGFDKIENVVFSSDSRHIAYRAKDDGQRVVVDGQPSPSYDALGLDHGGRLLAATWREPALLFQKDGRLEFLAQRGATLYRCRFDP